MSAGPGGGKHRRMRRREHAPGRPASRLQAGPAIRLAYCGSPECMYCAGPRTGTGQGAWQTEYSVGKGYGADRYRSGQTADPVVLHVDPQRLR